MAVTLLILNLFCLLSILISSGAHEVNIQAYRHYNFTGLVWESNSSALCSNIPEDKRAWVYSIRADACFIAYWHPNCESWRSLKFMPGNIILSPGKWIGSIQVCNEEESGSQLNLDITKYYYQANVLESFRNVCSCVNVPQYVQNMDKWSINNHHNALLAYYESNCAEYKWNSTFIAAGLDANSRNVHWHTKEDSETNTIFKYKSFGPDPHSTYFQTSCNASHVTNTEGSKTFTKENQKSLNADFNKRWEVLANQIAELHANQSDIRKE